MQPMKVSDLGEFGLIRHIEGIFSTTYRKEVVLGIGDDAAVWERVGDTELATTDILVEGVHFDLRSAGWDDLGWKALAVNLSDIAAMGGVPEYALLSLALPPDTELQHVADLCTGMVLLAREHNVAIVGGNVSRASQLIVSLSVVGSTNAPPLTRSGAQPGESIAVTGWVGQSAAGLRTLTSEAHVQAEAREYLRSAHLRPRPRVREGQALVRHGVRTAIDLSDGLLSDLRHICEAGGVTAELSADNLPIHEFTRLAAGQDAMMLALAGGEDYELLFTASDDVVSVVARDLDIPATTIGTIKGKGGPLIKVIGEDGRRLDITAEGWDHLR